jgi:activating signal cointegrator complex subunit 1
MRSQLLLRSFRTPLVLGKGIHYSTRTKSTMSSGKQNTVNQPQKPRNRNQRRERQPALTHFLCLPLVNTVSLPQLEESIAAFTAANPPVPVADLSNGQQQTSDTNVSQAVIPQGAVRPVGTIHLTIGVMSLPTKERLDEALAFFQTLDLAGLLREAERVAYELRQKRAAKMASSKSAPNTADASSHSSGSSSDETHTPQPLSVSLESLHALPRAKAATVLHASPNDSTGRLYPFCVMLRDKFLEAGFMLSEAKSGLPAEKKDPQVVEEVQASQCKDLNTDDNPLLEEMTTLPAQVESVGVPKLLDPYAAALARKPKPRPLLLHATLVNTIYVRGRRKFQNGGNGKNGRNGSKRLEFDARGLLARYRNYYVDEMQRTPRVDTSAHSESSTESSPLSEPAVPEGDEAETESNPNTSSATSHPQYPFVWARNIPINSVSICEMGAKKLEIGGPGDQGMNARLGEEYTVIAERSLDSRPRLLSPSP